MYGMLYKNKVLLGSKVCDKDWGWANEVQEFIFPHLHTFVYLA